MVQIRKDEVHKAILNAARKLYRRKGYSKTSMAEIAKEAGISRGNTYIYFKSKLDIFFAIYDEWLTTFIDDLERRVRAKRTPEAKIKTILMGLWKELPEDSNDFSSSLIEALTTKTSIMHSRKEAKDRIYQLLKESLPEKMQNKSSLHLPQLLFMTMDGFVVDKCFKTTEENSEKISNLMTELILK